MEGRRRVYFRLQHREDWRMEMHVSITSFTLHRSRSLERSYGYAFLSTMSMLIFIQKCPVRYIRTLATMDLFHEPLIITCRYDHNLFHCCNKKKHSDFVSCLPTTTPFKGNLTLLRVPLFNYQCVYASCLAAYQ